MKKLLFILIFLSFATRAHAGGCGTDDSAVQYMTSVITTSPTELRMEARDLGIPQDQVKRYVVYMREINREYQDGSLTRTQYVGMKRRLIDRLK